MQTLSDVKLLTQMRVVLVRRRSENCFVYSRARGTAIATLVRDARYNNVADPIRMSPANGKAGGVGRRMDLVMRRIVRFLLLSASVLAAAQLFLCRAEAKPGAIAPQLDLTPDLSSQDQVLLNSLRHKRASSSSIDAEMQAALRARPNERPLDLSGTTRERIDFGHIGGVALITREVDQYGRIRGVDFFTYESAASRWNMKLNVKHGAMLQLTRRWGGGARPLSYREVTSLAAENR